MADKKLEMEIPRELVAALIFALLGEMRVSPDEGIAGLELALDKARVIFNKAPKAGIGFVANKTAN